MRAVIRPFVHLYVRLERVLETDRSAVANSRPGASAATAETVEPLREAVAASAAPRRLGRARTRLASLVVGTGVAIFSLLGWLVDGGYTAGPDLAVSVGVQEAGNPLLVGLMVAVSALGFPPLNAIIVAAAVAFFWLAGFRLASLFALLSAVGVATLGILLKLVWMRPRPLDGVIEVIGAAPGYSFPSGHTLFYTSFFGFLFYWCFAFLRAGRLRTALLWLFGLLIVLVGPSRVYLGHHWASDVLAGYALGLAYLFVLIRVYGAVRLSGLGGVASEQPALSARR